MSEWINLTPTGEGGHCLFFTVTADGYTAVHPGHREFGKLKPDARFPTTFFSDAEALAFAAQLPEVRALVDYVVRQEWEGDRSESFCLACGRTQCEGHSDDCRWVAALAPFTEAPNE
jgi:hypothetical protein